MNRVLEQALATEVKVMRKRASAPFKVNPLKHYRYHRNQGHSIEEYTTLKDKIEDLIKKGCLKDFIHKSQSTEHQSSDRYGEHDRGYRLDRNRSRRDKSQGSGCQACTKSLFRNVFD
ncbi:hypothetical protein JHK85_004471 [Glycine max]|nr:hypothetical protein JHK85_004471 [Glycine max]KAG5080230.1 hypothetical protein JHK86_004295 [Glycine max]